ncbi:ABC transporter substrate-binding protein [Massilia cavernae]|uniref:ABC transporter substrate-binding protein n=1 Tax=Massilia cavernae TaxID=2320864 RepID=A0A418XRP5_9BURK|nr:ABC transporter substrate-binding protein [Massilia cavernae]RJG15211.1 ABC transporter substrate-binding protein [Massilia cavernae]
METTSDKLVREFASAGKLRASINLGNPILARQPAPSAKPAGVSVDLATEFARRLGVEIELVLFDAAGKAAEALKNRDVDIGFVALDPLRGEGIRFSHPYVQIEGSYLVRAGSPVASNDDVDQLGNRVTVGAGSAYDLHLSRSLKHAQIVRAPTSPTVVDTFIEQQLEVAAGVRQQLEHDAQRFPGLRVLDGRFMVINQAMGIPGQYSDEAWRFLSAFIEEMKQTGFVARSLAHHRIDGAVVAPAAPL